MSLARCLAALAVVALLDSANAFAESETYEQIRIDAGITGSTVGVSGRNGAGVVTEIKAMVTVQLAIGGRVEVAVMFGGRVGQDDATMDVAMAACGLVKAEYFLVDGHVRPFLAVSYTHLTLPT